MRTIYLPNLKRIKLRNYSLYPNGLDFEYDFVEGVNLIVGGNGMGKTTFVNLIKFALIGNYRKELDFTRTYKGREIVKRIPNPATYFANRRNPSVVVDQDPEVTLTFEINNTEFVVNRSLIDPTITSVDVDGEALGGKRISQVKYDALTESLSNDWLPFRFEKRVEQCSGLTFDDLIFFTNEILYFGEEHKTVLWDDSLRNVQEELFNKYFNEPDLDQKRQTAKQQAQYFDSLSRHRSEDMRAIRSVLDKIESESESSTSNVPKRVLELRDRISKLDNELESKHEERSILDDAIRLLNNQINTLTADESELEKSRKQIEQERTGLKWMTVHKNYDILFQNIKLNGLCSMCNQEVDEAWVRSRIEHELSCFLCLQPILTFSDSAFDEQFETNRRRQLENYERISNAEREIRSKETAITALDIEFRQLVTSKRSAMSELRSLEKEAEDVSSSDLQAFYDRIEVLQAEKDFYQNKSKSEQEKATAISRKIDDQISKSTGRFSELFAGFANRFLGVNCSLTFTNRSDQPKENRRFFPVISGTIRYYEEELSESQRFFVDHAFRMSILASFYNGPTFYIVETPNSSLDISYENTAADVFLKFLEQPNALILTTNLNNSNFLTHLLNYDGQVGSINLLEIGKASEIQLASEEMMKISKRLSTRVRNER